MNKYLIALATGFWISSCSVSPQEIAYGEDGCHYCKMTIVDKQHAAQIVTVKGKAFKYDAIECMMNHMKKWDGPDIRFYLVSDFEAPGTLTNATAAQYLITESIPSPMGEFLTGFSKRSDRDKLLTEVGGEALSWEELSIEFGLDQ